MGSLDRVPARRVDAAGKAHVDQRAILALALPLMANSAVQLVLNLTDIWFIGRISTRAVAAVSAVHWLAFVVLLVLSGLGMAVQTVVAQAHGARRQARAAQAVWIALWGLLLTTPVFLAVGLSIRWMLAPFGLPADIVDLAAAFWLPRVGGSCFGAGVWALLGFFNGIGRPRVTLLVTAVMAVANAIFNPILIFHLHLGVAGSGLATMAAQACGLVIAVAAFLRGHYRRGYRTHLTWTPNLRRIWIQWRIGFPMGLLMAADLIGFSVFQLMQVKLGEIEGAASQIVMIMTAVAYLPGVGIAMAGTTLVGQSIGAGDRNWAYVLGSRVIMLASIYMGGVGVLLAACGPWLLPLFMAAPGASSAAVIALSGEAPVDRIRLSIFRRTESVQRVVPARGRRCQDSGNDGDRDFLVPVRAPGAHAHLCPGPGLGRFPAAVGSGGRGRLDQRGHLFDAGGRGAAGALALARVAAA